MQSSRQAAAQLCRAASLLQARGMAKAVTTKLNVTLLKDVEGMGEAGDVVRANHGYVRNFLVPQRLAAIVPKPRRGAAQAVGGDAASRQQQQQQQQGAADPAQQSLERQQQQFDKLLKTLTQTTLTLKRRTTDGQTLEQALTAQEIAEAVGKQLRIRMAPDMLDMGGETLRVVGEYQLPLKLVLPGGDRAQLDVTVATT